MWSKQRRVTTARPLRDTCPVRDCRSRTGNNAEEEVRMNLRARRGRVYLTPWPASQSAVRPFANAWAGYDLQGHGGLGLMGSSLIRGRDTPALTDSVPAALTQKPQSPVRASLFSFDLWENWSWQAPLNHLCVQQRKQFSHAPLKASSVFNVRFKTSDSPVLKLKCVIKKKHKAKWNPRWPEYNWGFYWKRRRGKIKPGCLLSQVVTCKGVVVTERDRRRVNAKAKIQEDMQEC